MIFWIKGVLSALGQDHQCDEDDDDDDEIFESSADETNDASRKPVDGNSIQEQSCSENEDDMPTPDLPDFPPDLSIGVSKLQKLLS